METNETQVALKVTFLCQQFIKDLEEIINAQQSTSALECISIVASCLSTINYLSNNATSMQLSMLEHVKKETNGTNQPTS